MDAGKPPSGSNNRRASDAAPRAARGTASPNSFAAESLADESLADELLAGRVARVAAHALAAVGEYAPEGVEADGGICRRGLGLEPTDVTAGGAVRPSSSQRRRQPRR